MFVLNYTSVTRLILRGVHLFASGRTSIKCVRRYQRGNNQSRDKLKMTSPINLEKLTETELQDFLSSFDTVFTDCDGVLWHLGGAAIEGSLATLNALQNLGKKIYFVSNNSFATDEDYNRLLAENGFHLMDNDQVITPAKVATWYLNKINFQGEAAVMATQSFRDTLSKGGIKLIEPAPNMVEDNLRAFMKAAIDSSVVDAVVIDIEPNFNYVKLARSLQYLQKDNVILVVGVNDSLISINPRLSVAGPGVFTEILSRYSGKMPVVCSKPSDTLRDYMFQYFNITRPERCIFIGDTVENDFKFASLCGFKKLFVESGASTLENFSKQGEPLPEYHLKTLGKFLPVLTRRCPSQAENIGFGC